MNLLGLFIAYPWGALLVAVALAWLAARRRQRRPAVVAACWAGYAVYEFLMKARVLCSGECNIRVDLLLVYPLLLGLTLWALLACRRQGG